MRSRPVAISRSACSAESREIGVRRRQQLVAGELLAEELVPGLVGVEGADHVVAVAIGPLPPGVELAVAVAVGVAGHVEPMAGPALAVGG
jgi:hypothetical protein